MKKVLSVLSIFTLIGIFIFPLSGCSQPLIGNEQVPPVSTKPVVPLLDKQAHGSLETAYFALG